MKINENNTIINIQEVHKLAEDMGLIKIHLTNLTIRSTKTKAGHIISPIQKVLREKEKEKM
jgi:hypothetical protein